MGALSQLIERGGPPLGPGSAFDPGGAGATPLAAELAGLIAARDGFFVADEALVVFPGYSPAAPLDLVRLNAGNWRNAYWHLCQGLYFFAADALGDLFALAGDKVVRFATETGMAEPMADSLEGWAEAILADPAGQTGWPFMKAWREANGPVRPGWRLTGREPFVLGGGFDLANLQAVDLVDILTFRGRLASKIHDLPPGAEIRMAT
ncbi:MAG TPA: hypothetical protein VG939_13300 [Caulobacteraceae bacterium]|nr:hypothetical protein [Caulobacteraceae bacterium]